MASLTSEAAAVRSAMVRCTTKIAIHGPMFRSFTNRVSGRTGPVQTFRVEVPVT